jgi:hypothetical protein
MEPAMAKPGASVDLEGPLGATSAGRLCKRPLRRKVLCNIAVEFTRWDNE